MTALRAALSDYVDEIFGGATSPRTQALVSRLGEIQQNNLRYFTLGVAMLAVTFAAAMGLIIFGLTNRSATITVASVFGVSLVGMIRLMLALWREKVATEMLIALSELDEGLLQQVAAKLLTRMR
jgi:hypothetical protein